MKQKNNRNLDARQSMLVESAYYQCNPPQHSALKRKKRPVVQDWMRHLIFVQLGRDDVRKVGSKFYDLHHPLRWYHGWHQHLLAMACLVCHAVIRCSIAMPSCTDRPMDWPEPELLLFLLDWP